MGVQPHSAPLPPRRPWFVGAMPPHRRLTYLIRQELERLMGARDKGELGAIRSFLTGFSALVSGGNVMGAELCLVKAKGLRAVVYAHSPGVGAIKWAPTLVIPWTHHLDRILRECGIGRLFEFKPEPERDVWGQIIPKTGRPPKSEKVTITLVPGRGT